MLPRDTRVHNEYHALIVNLGNIFCRKNSCCVMAVLSVAVGLVGAGCGTPGPKQPEAPAVQTPPPPGPSLGEVIHVNKEMRYVVLQCTALPSPGEEIRVFRGDQTVGRLRVTGPVHDVFVAADVVEGDMRQGDRIRR